MIDIGCFRDKIVQDIRDGKEPRCPNDDHTIDSVDKPVNNFFRIINLRPWHMFQKLNPNMFQNLMLEIYSHKYYFV